MLERQKKQIEKLKQNRKNRIEEIIVETLYVIFFISYNLFEMWLVYILGKYYGMVIEMTLIMVSFLISKAIFGIPLHFSNNFKCLGASFVAFYTAIRCTLSTNISIFTNVIIGIMVGAITSYIATYMYREKQKVKKRNLVKELVELDLDNDKIQSICKKNGLDEEIGFIVDFRMNHNEDLTCYEFSIDASTLNRKINKFLRVAK